MKNPSKNPSIKDLEIRFTESTDAHYLKTWLSDPSVKRWFPMTDEIEVNDSVNRWIGFSRYRCSLTATLENIPCGLATLYLQPYRKLAHQCEFGIIVDPKKKRQGIGSFLINHLSKLATENFKIEVLHLQVYEGNPAMHLYKKFGFKEYGKQSHFIKEKEGQYVGRIFMEKFLVSV